MRVSIHQPNYLPWLGYFDKIIKSDVWVVFDDVQYPNGKNHYGNRNKIRTNTGDKTIAMHINKHRMFRQFRDVELMHSNRLDLHKEYFETFYCKCPYYKDYKDDLFKAMEFQPFMMDVNMAIIKVIFDILDIKTEILYSSSLRAIGTGAVRIMNILKEIGATSYISGSGPGSLRYIIQQDFDDNNIELIWQQYDHPVYTQRFEPFISHLTVMDLIFNHGPESRKILLNEKEV